MVGLLSLNPTYPNLANRSGSMLLITPTDDRDIISAAMKGDSKRPTTG